MGFVDLHFKKEYLDFWELRRTATIHRSYGFNHTKEDCGSLRFFETVFLFFYFVKWSDGVRNTGLCDLCGLRDYITKYKQELEFPWMSNVVLGLCGLKTLKR